jgi:hypothetical protein
LSPLVTLSVGPEENNPGVFQVHKHVLLQFPFFQAALRQNTFVESQEEKISFVEEDPVQFYNVVEFMYEGQCYPRIRTENECDTLEVSLMVVRDVAGIEPEEYRSSLDGSIACGSHLTTSETLETVTGIIRLLCLAQRYELISLSNHCLEKLKLCPFGTREVAALVEHISTQVPETKATAEIYEFLYEKIRIHRLRLDVCSSFQLLYENEAVPAPTINTLLSTSVAIQADFIHKNSNAGQTIAYCIIEVKAEKCLAKYGPDTDDHYVSKFGSARVGEMFIAEDNTCDSRGLFTARNTWDGKLMAFPKSSFHFLNAAS